MEGPEFLREFLLETNPDAKSGNESCLFHLVLNDLVDVGSRKASVNYRPSLNVGTAVKSGKCPWNLESPAPAP